MLAVLRVGQRQRGFGDSAEIIGQQAMGGEGDDAPAGQDNASIDF